MKKNDAKYVPIVCKNGVKKSGSIRYRCPKCITFQTRKRIDIAVRTKSCQIQPIT